MLAMSMPMTFTAGCSGAGLAVATKSTNLLTSDAASLTASSVSPSACASAARLHRLASLRAAWRRHGH